MINQKSKLPSNQIDTERRRLLITLGRSVLLVLTVGVTGFLVQWRRCRYVEGVDYSQLPCRSCRQIDGCGKPIAEIYRNDRTTGKEEIDART